MGRIRNTFSFLCFHSSQRVDCASVRQYLSQPVRALGAEVMRDAVVHQVPGAVILLDFLLNVRVNVRVNRRTRRSVDEVASAFLSGAPPRWLTRYVDLLWNFYRLLIKHRKIKDFFILLSSNFFYFFPFLEPSWLTFPLPSSLFLRKRRIYFCVTLLQYCDWFIWCHQCGTSSWDTSSTGGNGHSFAEDRKAIARSHGGCCTYGPEPEAGVDKCRKILEVQSSSS